MHSGDVMGMGKDGGDEEEKRLSDEGSKEGTTGGRRSKRDRRSRRKTNSECSPTPRPSITSDPSLGDDVQGTTISNGSEERAGTDSVLVGEQSCSVEDGMIQADEKSSPRTHYKREDSILSVGGKPKVVVPSPKGKTNMITGSVHLPRYSQAHTESQEPRECSIKAE